MKKNSPVLIHRLFLLGALLLGASLLMFNAWMVMYSESDFLLSAFLPS